MSSKRGQSRMLLVGCLAGLLVIGTFLLAVVWAAERTRPDYQGLDLNAPWFDGKSWDWGMDMVNMPSVKPQQEGTYQRFPLDSVPRQGVEAVIPMGPRREVEPLNPGTASAESVANGKKMYTIYCAACHGADGKSQTVVAQRGMPAIPIDALRLVFSESHLYNKIRYGQPVMPPYGFQTTQRERWDIVNYLKSAGFGK